MQSNHLALTVIAVAFLATYVAVCYIQAKYGNCKCEENEDAPSTER